MSYVKAVKIEEILAFVAETGEGKMAAKAILQKKSMLLAIEECRWEIPIADYTRAQHTILDVLQYLVEKT